MLKITCYNGWKIIPGHSIQIEIIDFQLEFDKKSFYLYFTLFNFGIIIAIGGIDE